MTLVLSLFPGIGLLDRAFEEEGFCVVRGPDLLWGGDIKRFHPLPRKFDGVIGGPPCAAFSRLRHLVQARGYRLAEDLIPEFARCVIEADPAWWLMENVPQAPHPLVPGSALQRVELVDAWVGGETRRRRVFWFGCDELPAAVGGGPVLRFAVETLALHRPDPEPPVLASGGGCPVPVAYGGSGKIKRTRRAVETSKGAAALGFKTRGYYREALRLSGLPPDFLSDAPFTVAGKIHAVGNGVPLAMGRAVARAVKAALSA